jgi:hypothetical protein
MLGGGSTLNAPVGTMVTPPELIVTVDAPSLALAPMVAMATIEVPVTEITLYNMFVSLLVIVTGLAKFVP